MARLTGKVASAAAIVSVLVGPTGAQAACTVDRQGIFPGDGERVRLARAGGLAPRANFGVFSAPMAVNTDGAPNSYHPEDYLGQTRAINRIGNGIGISRVNGQATTPAERRRVFDRWRQSGWVVPAGYRISWTNVIARGPDGKPCIFRSGPYGGYFGSLTALRNGLTGTAAGECLVKDQLDQRYIPAIVLRGGSANPLYGFGARKGDLVLALNPVTGTAVPAVIGDTGDGNRIGEGSVALNMRLLGASVQPTTYTQALRLDTGNRSMIVAVLPHTIQFELARPYSTANIEARLRSWAQQKGYGSLDALVAAVRECAVGL